MTPADAPASIHPLLSLMTPLRWRSLNPLALVTLSITEHLTRKTVNLRLCLPELWAE
jgi:hypothetical protein